MLLLWIYLHRELQRTVGGCSFLLCALLDHLCLFDERLLKFFCQRHAFVFEDFKSLV